MGSMGSAAKAYRAPEVGGGPGTSILASGRDSLTSFQVGIVFKRPNPLPVSIRDNIPHGYKLHTSGRKLRRRSAED